MSKWSHLMLWPVVLTWSANAGKWSCFKRALKCSVFRSLSQMNPLQRSQKDVIVLLPYIGLHSNLITRRLKSCVNRFYSFVNVKVIFQNTRRIKSFFPYKDRLNRSQLSKVIYKASCWDCNDFYIGKTKRRLNDRKTEHFKALFETWSLLCNCWSR